MIFILIFIANLVSLFLMAGIISSLKGFNLKDVLFVEGILILMICRLDLQMTRRDQSLRRLFSIFSIPISLRGKHAPLCDLTF